MPLDLKYDSRWSDKADDKFISDYNLLQNTVFQNGYSKELFKKKYLENIYGPSIIIVVYGNGKPIGARAFWRNDIDGIEAYQPGDVCVLEECRGKGVFTEMTKRAFAMLPKDAIIYTFPNSNSFPAHLKMGNKLIASYYPRLFSHKRYQKEHTLKLDKEYAKWWLTSNDRIEFIERQRAFYLVSDYGLPFMYMVLAEVDEKTAKMFHRANPFGIYFYRSTKQSFYNKNKRPLYIVCKNENVIYIPTWKVDSLGY